MRHFMRIQRFILLALTAIGEKAHTHAIFNGRRA
jgi:hypothetical protein